MNTRLNLGCGQTPTPGWRNFDNSPSILLAKLPLLPSIALSLGLLTAQHRKYIDWLRQNRIEWADVSRRIPCRDASVDTIYTSHMVEHLDKWEVQNFLREVKRVLRRKGTLRIAVPNLALYINEYQNDGNADRFIEETRLAVAKPRGFIQRLKYLLTGARHHHWMYDAASLTALLSEAGFTDVRVLPPGQTTIEDPGELNLFERAENSLYVEGKNGD
jgi:predicted SAM-dependent methyltransferase